MDKNVEFILDQLKAMEAQQIAEGNEKDSKFMSHEEVEQ